MSTRQTSFAIQGMFCARCAAQVERALTCLQGVIAAQVNYAAARATVICDPRLWNPAAAVAVIRALGFNTPLQSNLFTWGEWWRATHLPADAVVECKLDWRKQGLNVELLPNAGGGAELGWHGLLRALWRTSHAATPPPQDHELVDHPGELIRKGNSG